MKHISARNLLYLLLAVPLLPQEGVFAQDFSEPRLQQACEALLLNPTAPLELQTLAEASRFATNNPSLRCRAMAAYSLSFLMQGNTNAFERALQVMRATDPDAPSLIKVTPDDCFSMCQTCLGSGKKMTLCPTCMGSGKCKVCSGSGNKGPEPCSACKATGACGMCLGKKRIKTVCPICKGSTLVFNPKDTVRTNFTGLLSEMVALCQENVRFREHYRLASQETNLTNKIELLKALIQSFPHRSDIGPALAMLEQTLNAQKNEESRRREKDKREQEDRKRAELLSLRDVETKELNGTIATLLTYLAEHPDCSGYLELKVLADELIARRNRTMQLRKLLYGVLSLFGVFIVVGVLRPLVFRKKAETLGPLPGMDKIDKAQFTDPLKLNAQASKARVKTKTTEIEPPEENAL